MDPPSMSSSSADDFESREIIAQQDIAVAPENEKTDTQEVIIRQVNAFKAPLGFRAEFLRRWSHTDPPPPIYAAILLPVNNSYHAGLTRAVESE